MTERHGDPRFYELLNEIADLHSRKNHDYARQDEPLSNFRRSLAFGVEPWRGIFIRMSDKWSRIEELSKGKQPKNESLRDSLVDNAVYSLLAVLLLDEVPTERNRAAQNIESEPAHIGPVPRADGFGYVPGAKYGAKVLT